MIDIPVIDAHLHLWDPGLFDYPWQASVPILSRRFDLDDYQAACGPADVSKMVFLQCEVEPSQSLREAEWIASLAQQDTRLSGIVPWAPLEQGGGVCESLDRLTEIPLVKGVRRILEAETDPDFCLQAGFVEGVRMLARYGLSFDICITHHQLPAATKLVEMCPDVAFVLDHFGKPDIRHHVVEPWRTQIERLAQLPNIDCKVSGLVTEADHQCWQPEDLRPYLAHVLDTFGFDRVMFGGDWPVVLQAASLQRWIEVLSRELAGCSPDEKRQLFSENAQRFYRLEWSHHAPRDDYK